METREGSKMRSADGSELCVLREASKVPFKVGSIACPLTIFVINNTPLLVSTGHLAMKMMRASLDFDKKVAIFRSGERNAVCQLWTDDEVSVNQLSEKFTSDKEMSTQSNDFKNDNSEREDGEWLHDELELADCLREGKKDLRQSAVYSALQSPILHREETGAGTIIDPLRHRKSIITQSIDEVRPGDIPYRHEFELSEKRQYLDKCK